MSPSLPLSSHQDPKHTAIERQMLGWTIKKFPDDAIVIWKEGVGGVAAEHMDDNIARSILWEVANDLFAAAAAKSGGAQ